MFEFFTTKACRYQEIFIGYLRIVQRRLDYLPVIVKGGYVMMVFQRMHLDTGKRQ